MSDSCSSKKASCNSIKKDRNIEKHWCDAYTGVDITKLGWYENKSIPTLELIKKSGISKNATILNVGAGATTLIDDLLQKGYTKLIVNDISSCAMENIKARIGNKTENVEFITDDIIHPKYLDKINKVDLWNDRAVLHFFTEEEDQNSYFSLLKQKVKNGGFVILSEFNLQGAKKCSGLDVKRYDSKMLQDKLGKEFQLLEEFDYDYIMPSGNNRKYIYTLFQRV